MKSICLKKIPDDLYNDLNRIKELDNRTLTSIILEGARMRVKELGIEIADSRKRRNSLNDMCGF
jgi:hypothetical protein